MNGLARISSLRSHYLDVLRTVLAGSWATRALPDQIRKADARGNEGVATPAATAFVEQSEIFGVSRHSFRVRFAHVCLEVLRTVLADSWATRTLPDQIRKLVAFPLTLFCFLIMMYINIMGYTATVTFLPQERSEDEKAFVFDFVNCYPFFFYGM